MKNIRFFYLKFSFFGGKIFSIFEWASFRNGKEPNRTFLIEKDEKCGWGGGGGGGEVGGGGRGRGVAGDEKDFYQILRPS